MTSRSGATNEKERERREMRRILKEQQKRRRFRSPQRATRSPYDLNGLKEYPGD